MKRLLLAVVLVALAASPARAENAEEVAAALRGAPVYQASGLGLVDVATLTAELADGDPQVYVAVLPASAAGSAAQARQRAIDIGRALAVSDSVVLVITANRHFGTGQGSAASARGVDSRAALRAELQDLQGFTKDALTALALSFAERVTNQAGTPAPGVSNDGGAIDPVGGSGGAWLVGGVLVAGAGVAAVAVRSSRRRSARLLEGLRADVEQLYERLGADVLNLEPGDNAVARQALADAAERYSACGGQLASADAPAELAAARRTAVEGLTAARAARVALGIDPGPEVPPVAGEGPQLATEERVTVGGQDYDGSPTYAPGRPHYYGGGPIGGQQVPGGWYSGNFWAPFLLGSVLTGGFGGFGGHDSGSGGDSGPDGGADNGSGGDWGGGGGDWGGGGDAGGGGGDW